jgi:hypothetical protein
MEKQSKDSEKARQMKQAEQEAIEYDTSQNSPAERNNAAPERRSYARMASYTEWDEEDFLMDGTSTSRAYCIDDDPTDPDYRISLKRPSPHSSSYNKKAKVNDLEIIDLTDSPPRNRRRVDYSADSSPWEESIQRRKAFVAPPYISEKFTLHDCSDEQQHILNLVSEGKNVFFTGSAGVGKSFVLNKISQLFKSKGLKQFSDFFITASTGIPIMSRDTDVGIAAVHIGGMTVHSFSGTGKGEDGVLDLKEKVKRSKRSKKHWTECKTLVIDEVSMVQHL